jgi:hypothetical protein
LRCPLASYPLDSVGLESLESLESDDLGEEFLSE